MRKKKVLYIPCVMSGTQPASTISRLLKYLQGGQNGKI